jgi:hypothetical protein
VIVIFTSDGTESSTGSREKEFPYGRRARPRGITAHAFVLKTQGLGHAEIVAEPHAEHGRTPT